MGIHTPHTPESPFFFLSQGGFVGFALGQWIQEAPAGGGGVAHYIPSKSS